MGSFKARLAKEPRDREMHEHLAKAARELAVAESLCAQSARALRGPSSKYGGQFASRALENLRRIRQANRLVGSVGLNVPNRDFTDLDMMSEDALSARAQQERELRDEAHRIAAALSED